MQPFSGLTPQQARELTAAGVRPPTEAVGDVASVVLARGDHTEFEVRVVSPVGDPAGVIVYLHGGGWVVGSVDGAEPVARRLANLAGCTVVLPDYSLAPERPFPCALDDVRQTMGYVEASPLGGLPLVIAGDSAGGNLAAVTALRSRRDAEIRISQQVLVYPVVDTDMTRPSYRDPGNQLLLTAADMAWFAAHYATEAQRATPDVAPLQASSLAGLPPTVLVQAPHDVLFDEGSAYGQALRDAGVPVDRWVVPGQMHGFFTLFDLLPGGAEAVEFVAAAITGELARRPDPASAG
ncbi:hypothetical protein GCM10023175_52890 [Pseudonocardia xishanensis]|uniref:Alpha/beta hydrolase fold-3 domain-containing protein n=1 Tax=Pseudonocardia xishanensis TaxID=630995 RepID=A0ABP8RZF2_9PSEU